MTIELKNVAKKTSTFFFFPFLAKTQTDRHVLFSLVSKILYSYILYYKRGGERNMSKHTHAKQWAYIGGKEIVQLWVIKIVPAYFFKHLGSFLWCLHCN